LLALEKMFYSAILILLTILLYIRIKKVLDKSFIRRKDDCQHTQYEYDSLLQKNIRLQQDNFALEKTAEEIIALYDITKEICKSLEAEKVYGNFREEINKYLKLDDCKLLPPDADLSAYSDYIILPLDIDKHPIGYLVARGIKEEDKNKFHILAQQFLLGMKRAHLYQKVQELAITDSLTGASSRRYCLERLNEEIERSGKFKYRFSFLMVDIDHFKSYNDRYGHLVGDAILREVAKTIKETIRQIDLMGRYGGEEFSVILTETDKQQARLAAERIRQAVESKEIRVYDENLKVTISSGISTFPDDAQQMQALIDRADLALYQAKETGRNRVCMYQAEK